MHKALLVVFSILFLTISWVSFAKIPDHLNIFAAFNHHSELASRHPERSEGSPSNGTVPNSELPRNARDNGGKAQDDKENNQNDAAEAKLHAQAYLTKYITYQYWVVHLPVSPQPEFIQFIEPQTPLTQKLREKWLYLLAEHQDWLNFNQFYRSSDNTGLRCYAQIARYHLNQRKEAVEESFSLWMQPETQQSSACHALFALLLHENAFTNQQIEQRIAFALNHNQPIIAQELLNRLGPKYAQENKMLKIISQNPRKILGLQPGPLAGALYLYGLKLSVTRNLDTATTLWEHSLSTKLLTPAQKQQFLAHLALYKAIRNQKDTEQWLSKVQPAYRDAGLKDWAIRYALMQQKWQNIVDLTAEESLEHSDPFPLYWRARALEKLGHRATAHTIYRALANKRHYYGFLASIAAKQKFQFEAEPTPHDPEILTVYKPITDQIAQYYRTNQFYLAAHTLNEFSLELSKTEKSALVYWVATQLKWPGKAIYLSTSDDVLKNQLLLRFPLTYYAYVKKLSQQYHIAPALIYATIRQESTFLKDIKSDAGACGLMQIMPNTAKTIAKHAKIPYSNPKELFSPEKNLQIGVAYLNNLTQQFKAHPILIMAAYNAGPKQVRHWVKNHEPKEMDIWVETLPWQETRNYLKNVIAFYAVYQYRMHQEPNLNPFLQHF